MEIIKRGVKPEERQFTATCRICGTVVRFKQSEAKFTADQRDGDFYSVQCPVCSNSLHVSTTAYDQGADAKAYYEK